VRYIANNAVHEYISQGNVHQILDLTSYFEFSSRLGCRRRRARASGSRLTRIGRYGLSGVITLWPPLKQKLLSAQRATDEGDRFFKLTQDLEHGGK